MIGRETGLKSLCDRDVRSLDENNSKMADESHGCTSRNTGIFLSLCDGRVIPQRMLTPVFELSQDDDFVVVIIKTPYVKVSLNFV